MSVIRWRSSICTMYGLEKLVGRNWANANLQAGDPVHLIGPVHIAASRIDLPVSQAGNTLALGESARQEFELVRPRFQFPCLSAKLDRLRLHHVRLTSEVEILALEATILFHQQVMIRREAFDLPRQPPAKH